jgi:hypothetical protein
VTAVLALAAGGLIAGLHLAHGRTTSAALSANANAQTVPLLGSSVLSMGDLTHTSAQFGRMPIVRVYYRGLPPPDAWTTGLAGANHSAVIVSFKALPSAILSGADNGALRHFFDSAPRGHPIYFSYFHEPEDNIARGEFSAPAYRAAWHKVAALAAAAHNPHLRATLILMEYDLSRYSHRHWRDYFPSGGIIKVLGWDAYPVGSATNDNPQLTPPATFMGPCIAASRSAGLPFGFAEFGLSTARGRAAWMIRVGKYLMHSGALFGSLFNGNTQYPTLHLGDKASVAVWRAYIRESRIGRYVPVTLASIQPGSRKLAS